MENELFSFRRCEGNFSKVIKAKYKEMWKGRLKKSVEESGHFSH